VRPVIDAREVASAWLTATLGSRSKRGPRNQQRRGLHDDHCDVRYGDSLERNVLALTSGQHLLDTGESFFGVITYNHCLVEMK
jgi:hypothetical protein